MTSALLAGISSTELFGNVMLFVSGVVLAVSARYIWRATAVFRAVETTQFDQQDPGTLVRISGKSTLEAEEPLIAPFSGTDTVALQYSIEERRLSFPYLFPWYATVHESTGSIAFDVETTGQTVSVVEPTHTVTLTNHIVATVKPNEEPPEQVARFEQNIDAVHSMSVWRDPPSVVAPLFRALSIGTRRYGERRASLGNDITVVGRTVADGTGIDPLVVSDCSPHQTVFRMAKTSLVGLGVGLLTLPFGYFLFSTG